MNTASVIGGNVLVGVMVCTPAPVMLNAIVSTVGKACPATHSPAKPPEAVFVLAAVIASRSVQTPSLASVSAVLLTVMVAARAEATARQRDATMAEARAVGFRMISPFPLPRQSRVKSLSARACGGPEGGSGQELSFLSVIWRPGEG